MFRRYLFLLGVYLRNKEIFKQYKFLKESEKWDLEKLNDYRKRKFLSLVNWAYNNSEFYKRKFNEFNVNLHEIMELEDIKKLPIITKDELKKYNSKIQVSKGFSKLFYSETSGSTGEPLIFYRNEEWDAGHRAAIFRGYSWHGVKPWEKNGYFWGYNIDPKKRFLVELFDYLQNRFRLFSLEEVEIKKFLKKLSTADYLEGYSSMIYEIAKYINENNISFNNKLKMIKGTSEKIFDLYKIETEKAFKKTIISEYGSAEAGIIAFECPNGNMHITMENVIVEEMDGEIIVTNLLSKSFPIIRYKLGDYIKIDRKTKCECGMQHHIISEVIGRVGKLIYGYENKYPSLTLYYVFKNLASEKGIILNYQAIQNVKGKLTLNIEQRLEDFEKKYLEKELYKYFKNDLEVNINDGIDIKSKKNKQKDFISKL